MSNRYNHGFFKSNAKGFAVGGEAKKTKEEKKREKAKFIDKALTKKIKGADVGKKAGGKYINLDDYYSELPIYGAEEMYLPEEYRSPPKGGYKKKERKQ